MTKFSALMTVLLLSLLAPSIRAQGVEDINLVRSRFFVDHAVFADTANNRLEVYYKIFNDGLNYVKKGDKFVANYEVNIIIVGDKDKQVTGKSIEKSYALDTYDQTRSETGFLINQVALPLPPGQFNLVAKLIDHNSNDVSTIESKINSYHFTRAADISDIEFILEQTAADQPQFVKGGFTVLPTVERSLDGELQKLGVFAEVCAGDYVGKTLQLKYRIDNNRQGARLDTTLSIPIDGPIVRVRQFLPVGELPPEEYNLSLSLLLDGKSLAERATRFLIKWSVASLIKNDFQYAVDQLKYVITKEEKKELMQTPDSLRMQAFENFWKKHDPSPGSSVNELREEYYRRIRYANQYYSTVNREGWETDRGMIYIKYGEPDQIERHPFELDSKPYQLWYYYGQRRTFAFIDTRGDGDYQLQYPFDGDWRTGVGP
jgi:GWxTD domain-containing protein